VQHDHRIGGRADQQEPGDPGGPPRAQDDRRGAQPGAFVRLGVPNDLDGSVTAQRMASSPAKRQPSAESMGKPTMAMVTPQATMATRSTTGQRFSRRE